MGYNSMLAIQKWSTIVGAFLLMVPIGLPYYWGNMSTYILSYFLVRRQSETGVQTQWIIAVYFSCEAIGLFVAGLISKRVGQRLGLLCGMVLFLGGIFGTYGALKSSIVVMNFTIGMLSGLGCGFVIGMSMEYAVPWAGKHVGLVTSLIQSGFNAGPLIINMFITKYTNPQNKSPDFVFGPSSYFSQNDILDNVSYLFVVFGFLCLGFQLFGFLMVREYKTPSDEKESLNQGSRETEDCHGEDGEQFLSPKQVLKTLSFYTLWTVCIFYTLSIVIILTYYKSFGQIWIKDDYFLAWVGTAFTLATLVFGPIWGIITDSVGVKMSMVLMLALSSLQILFIYFAPGLGKWVYLVAMVLYGSSSAAVFPTMMTASCKLYGKKNQSTNFGLINSSDIIMAFVTPRAMEMLLVGYGWFTLIFFGACLNMAAVLVVIFALPKC